jgi:hypothetical protein
MNGLDGSKDGTHNSIQGDILPIRCFFFQLNDFLSWKKAKQCVHATSVVFILLFSIVESVSMIGSLCVRNEFFR